MYSSVLFVHINRQDNDECGSMNRAEESRPGQVQFDQNS